MKQNKEVKKAKGKYTGYIWTFYPQNGQGYLKFNNNEIKRQSSLVDSRVIIDLDEQGEIVGVEINSL